MAFSKFTTQSIIQLYGILRPQTANVLFAFAVCQCLPGLGNDLDGGLPFFPKSISSENELVDYYHADRFLEMAAKLPNPSESFKEFIKGISEEIDLEIGRAHV